MEQRYLHTPHIPAGAVLLHMLKRSGISQRRLAADAGIAVQRINDFIKGKRRISATASLEIERALGVDIKGYFYIIQANHDLYLAEREDFGPKPDLSKFKRALFWDMDIDRIRWTDNKATLIRRIFEYGDKAAIDEAIRLYGRAEVKSVLESITDPRLASRRHDNYLNTHPELIEPR